MINASQPQQSTMQQIREWIDFTLQQNGVSYLSNMIRVRWNKRFVKKFADAGYGGNPPRGIIRIGTRIWERASETERRETIIHETCHIVAFHLHGTEIKPHGTEWKAAMAKCGVEPIRCHDVNLFGIALFRVLGCPKPEDERCTFSRRTFTHMKRTGAIFHCTICGKGIGAEQIEC